MRRTKVEETDALRTAASASREDTPAPQTDEAASRETVPVLLATVPILRNALTATAGPQLLFAAEPWPTAGISSFRRFRQDERHVTRVFREHVLLFLFEGVLHFQEDGVATAVSAGEWYLQEAGRLQTGNLACPAPVYYYIHFAARMAPACGDGWQEGLPLARRGTFRPELFRPLFERMDAFTRHNASARLHRQGMFLDLLAALSEADVRNGVEGSSADNPPSGVRSADATDADARTSGSAEQARHMLVWLEAHAGGPVTLEELSNRFHFSQDAVIRILRRWTGATPGQWLRRFRLERARMLLLDTDDPLPTIAQAAGYGDVSLLHRAFRAEEGMAPGAWRRRARGMPPIDKG